MYRLLPGGWVTLQDVYRCTIDAELFAERIREAQDLVAEACPARVVISHDDMIGHPEALNDWVWIYTSGEDTVTCRLDPVLRDRLAELEIPFETEEGEGGAGSELRDQVEAIERWYLNDWMALDAKLRTSIVEGISVFLSLFDQPQVASVFCPPPPDPDESIHMYSAAPDEDPEAVRPMINGPGNVWVERSGELEPIEAPALTAAALYRAAIHIARPLGLDPATRPILDARLEDGSRVAICTPPASPHVAMTIRRFGGRAFSAEDLVGQGALPETVFRAARDALHSRRNILVSGGTGSGKTTLLNALIELLPTEERIVAIEDTLELRIDRTNCLRFEAGAVGSDAPVSIRDLVRHALRHRPDHIVVGEVRGGEAADLLQALNTGHGGSLTTVHANNARSALSRLASCAMQAGGALPWEVTCRGVVDGISLVVHMTRRGGRRFVEEAIRVRSYDSAANRWLTDTVWRKHDEEATDKE